MRQIVQKPGEFVITGPGVYHTGFNFGFNAAESINFGTAAWLKVLANYTQCSCSYRNLTNLAIQNLEIIAKKIRSEVIVFVLLLFYDFYT